MWVYIPVCVQKYEKKKWSTYEEKKEKITL